LFIRAEHLSPPVMRHMVAMWSQFRAAVARPAVWQQVVLLGPDSRTPDLIWCSMNLRPAPSEIESSMAATAAGFAKPRDQPGQVPVHFLIASHSSQSRARRLSRGRQGARRPASSNAGSSRGRVPGPGRARLITELARRLGSVPSRSTSAALTPYSLASTRHPFRCTNRQ
jgi:hypothetical protein